MQALGARQERTCLSALRSADQLEAFVDEVIGEPVVLVANSVGGLSSLVMAANVRSHMHRMLSPRVSVAGGTPRLS